MHVCFVNVPIEYYSPVSGGALATVIMQSARVLIERGHKVTVLTMVNDDPVYDAGEVVPLEIKTRGDLNRFQRLVSRISGRINHWDLPLYGHYAKSYSDALRKLPAAPDAVVLLNDLVAPRYVRRVLPEAKIVVWFHNEWSTKPGNLASAIKASDAFLTCSGYIRNWMARNTGIPLQRMVVARNGVDLQAFKPHPGFLQGSDRCKVLYIGRIDSNKGPDIAASAVVALQKEGLPVSLTVAGGIWFYNHGNEMADPFFCQLKSLMDEAGADYMGHVVRDKVPEVVREHDVVCVLSRSNEPFGLVALEAMASGCAVIASNRGGLPEACGDAAILVDPDDLESVTRHMRSLVLDRELLNDYKRKSLEWAAKSPWMMCAETLERTLFPAQSAKVFPISMNAAEIEAVCA